MRETRVVAGAVIRDEHVLVALRGPGMSRAGLWELPGGKVEPGEPDRIALSRELAEELGITVSVGRLIGATTHRYPDIAITLVAYAATLETGVPVPREHAELRWIGRDQLYELDWAPADVPLLEPLARSGLLG